MPVKAFTAAINVDISEVEKRIPAGSHSEAFKRIQTELEAATSDIVDDVVEELEEELKEKGGENT